MSKLRIILASLGLVLSFSILAPTVHAADTSNFTINSFRANYILGRDNQNVPLMEVTESIAAEFPLYDQNHGILRAIPTEYKKQSLDIKIISVSNGSTRANYSTSNSNGYKVLKIGDADRYVHGTQYYEIKYLVKNYISFYDDHDEMYWNVNGTEWNQSFGSVTATIQMGEALSKELKPEQACYTGVRGSNEQNCVITREGPPENKVIKVSASGLSAGGNLSFVIAYNKGTFAVDKAAQRQKILREILYGAFLLLVPIITFLLLLKAWFRIGRDAKGRGTIIPQYVPLKELNSLTSDVLLKEKLRNTSITALIIELAIRKYIAISEVTKDKLIGKKTEYELKLLKSPEGLSEFEKEVIEMFFTGSQVGTVTKVNDLKNKLSKDFKSLAKKVPESLSTTGYFRGNPVTAESKYRNIGIGVLVLVFIFGKIGFAANGFIWLFVGSIAVSGLVIIIFARYMSARTTKGVEAMEYLEGLKMFMEVAEADRIKFLQSPEGVKQWGDPNDPKTQLKLFEKLLPYAIIFGIEKDWAKQFKDIYTQPPDWYRGNWSSFSTGYLIGSIGNFNTVGATAFAPAGSSSSSGFGGGGFSGGGGGGGGGGGW